jgi:hypothetical protein
MPVSMAIPPSAIFAAVFLMWLLARLPFHRARHTFPTQRIFFYLFIWLWLADIVNLIRIQTFNELKHVIGRAIFFILIVTTYYVVRDRERFYKLLRYLMWSVLILAGFTVLCAVTNFDPFNLMPKNPRTFWGVSMEVRRTQGLPMSHGEYGLILNAILPVMVVSTWKKNFFISRNWALTGMFVLLLGLFVSQSRNSWLATFFVFNFFAICWTLKSPDLNLRGIIIMLVLLLSTLALLGLSDYFSFAFEGFALGSHASTFNNRLLSDKIAFSLFLENPLLGVGHEEITRAIENQRGITVVVHNAYMDQLAGGGLLGFIPFISLLALTLGTLLRMARSGPAPWRFWSLCLAASFIANMSLLVGYKGFFSETFAVEYGLMLSLVEFCEKGRIKEFYERKNMPSHHYLLQPRRQ